jgi:UDP-N-acetylglucosamine diphosphorylase/glucosamine-1-phosphate N-acetyltransferase
MTDLYLLEADLPAEWHPFARCRPVSELRAGAWLVRERWEAIAAGEARGIFAGEHLLDFVEAGVPPVTPPADITGPAVIGLSTFAPSGVKPELPRAPATRMNDGQPVGWWVPDGAQWTPGATVVTTEEIAIDGLRLHGAYDVVTALEYFLVADTADFTHEGGDELPDGSIVIGDPADVVVLGALVEPGVVFDVRQGAVVIEQHAYVKSGTRFEGPVYVGPGTEVLGGAIVDSAFGPRCKVRGEIVSCSFLGYANKGHEGFLGHSVVGRWVNLGAGTTTSNLKNTYGGVRLEIGGARHETGRMFLGTLFADHAKTAIGTQLDTGTMVGVGANVFGWARPPKYVAPFAWGAEGVMRKDGFLDIASRVMPRRKVEFDDAVRAMLSRIYDHAVS